ncbi:hypothetical protein FF38_11351 [Lucilia cuprina]|uniref:Uncharacterized protein n=1 Tax=Lucilia cuprina TaxID=7375 RepID=A0A0L0CRG1_LUCCU|nr:hypothetical protein FF38_11351 [Lucilia cuprina]
MITCRFGFHGGPVIKQSRCTNISPVYNHAKGITYVESKTSPSDISVRPHYPLGISRTSVFNPTFSSREFGANQSPKEPQPADQSGQTRATTPSTRHRRAMTEVYLESFISPSINLLTKHSLPAVWFKITATMWIPKEFQLTSQDKVIWATGLP